jgi:hypothetical protein
MLSAETQSTRPGAVAPTSDKNEEARRIQRIALPLPMKVEALLDRDNGWSEMTRLIDVSAFGAGFILKRPLKRGRLVQLTLPMPRQLRSFDYAESQYKIWALVRRCIPIGAGPSAREFAIGTAFTGKHPPEGHFDDPSKLYDLTRREESGSGLWHLGVADLRADDSGLPMELRKQTRFFIPEPLRIEQVDDAGNVIFSESTVSENLSLGGAAVFSTLNAPAGTFLRLTSDRFAVTILSIVRGRRTGADGIPRLHVEFIDRLFPLEGIVNN